MSPGWVAIAVVLLLLLAACASVPTPDARIRVHVERPAQAFDLALPRQRAALAAITARTPGVDPAALWIVRCALGTDHGWTGLAHAPDAVTPRAGSAWWLVVDDAGDDHRTGSGRLLAPLAPARPGAARAYDADLTRHPAPRAGDYHTVFSEHWIRCRAADSR